MFSCQSDIKEKSVEVYDKGHSKLAIILTVEALLMAGIIWLWQSVSDGSVYILIAALIFLFLVVLSGLIPAINNTFSGNRVLVWLAGVEGLKLPNTTTTITKLKPPVEYEWEAVRGIIFTKTLVWDCGETRTNTKNAMLVLLEEFRFPDKLNLVSGLYRTKDGEYYQVLRYPKIDKEKILKKLKEIVPQRVELRDCDFYSTF